MVKEVKGSLLAHWHFCQRKWTRSFLLAWIHSISEEDGKHSTEKYWFCLKTPPRATKYSVYRVQKLRRKTYRNKDVFQPDLNISTYNPNSSGIMSVTLTPVVQQQSYAFVVFHPIFNHKHMKRQAVWPRTNFRGLWPCKFSKTYVNSWLRIVITPGKKINV